MTSFPASTTLLHRFLHWETVQAGVIALTEPRPDGQVIDYTWREIGDQARRMATQLLGLPPNSRIAILGKNSAHWIMADLAIWMAGHVSVPLYPTVICAVGGPAIAGGFDLTMMCDIRFPVVLRLDDEGRDGGAAPIPTTSSTRSSSATATRRGPCRPTSWPSWRSCSARTSSSSTSRSTGSRCRPS